MTSTEILQVESGQSIGRNCHRVVPIILYLIASWVILLAFLAYPGINAYGPSFFEDTISGQVHRPFAFRTLIPSTVRFISELTPDALKSKVETASETRRTLILLVRLSAVKQDVVFEYFLALLIIFICFVIFSFSIRRLAGKLYHLEGVALDFVPILALIILPIFFRYNNYLYDPATICLFTVGILAIIDKNRALFYAILILATINKETSLLLTAIFVVHEYKEMNRSGLMLHTIMQILFWIIFRLYVIHIYGENSGTNTEFHLFDQNLLLFLYPYRFFYFLAVATLFFLLIKLDWGRKPEFLRKSFLISFIPLFLAALLFGILDEVRIFYEVYPLAFLLSLPTIYGMRGGMS